MIEFHTYNATMLMYDMGSRVEIAMDKDKQAIAMLIDKQDAKEIIAYLVAFFGLYPDEIFPDETVMPGEKQVED